jgi:ketosteroid isomerase-like protein
MMERIEDREAAGRFVENWRANWSRVDIDAVVAHFSEDAEMRSPLAEKLTGSAVVQGADNIRQYWQKAYGYVKSADLHILTWSWDDNIRRLTIW